MNVHLFHSAILTGFAVTTWKPSRLPVRDATQDGQSPDARRRRALDSDGRVQGITDGDVEPSRTRLGSPSISDSLRRQETEDCSRQPRAKVGRLRCPISSWFCMVPPNPYSRDERLTVGETSAGRLELTGHASLEAGAGVVRGAGSH